MSSVEHDIFLTRDLIYSSLQALFKQNNLKAAYRLHSLIVSNGFEDDSFLANHLMRLFTVFGNLLPSRQIFCKMSKASIHSWNAIIQAHARLGEENEAVTLYELMQQSGCMFDKCTFCSVLKACGCIANIRQGMLIHYQIVMVGLDSDLPVSSALLDMYGKCGSLDSACQVFDTLPSQDIVVWGAIIGALAEHGEALVAFEYYKSMQCLGIEPNQVIFLCILKACRNVETLYQVRHVHDKIIRRGLESEKVVGIALVDTYGKCGSVDEAYQTLCGTACKDDATWSAMISSYLQHGHSVCAFELFKGMCQAGIATSQASAVCALQACSNLRAVVAGMLVNHCIICGAHEDDVCVGSTLIHMYAKSGCMLEAREIFEHLQGQDVGTWGALIAGYAQCGLDHDVFDLFETLKRKHYLPDTGIYISVLRSCANLGHWELGRLIHVQATKLGLLSNNLFDSALVYFYGKVGSFKEAEKIIVDATIPAVASWGILMGEHVNHGNGTLALDLFSKMNKRGLEPDKVIYLCVLNACCSIGALEEGRWIHNQIVDCGLEVDMSVGVSVIDMYSKCGSLDDAFNMLNLLQYKSPFGWASLIGGCMQHGKESWGLEVFKSMLEKGIKADRVIYLCATRACALMGDTLSGRLIHDQIVRSSLDEHDLEVKNVLVDMYAKWGSLWEAVSVFERIEVPDVVSWGSLIAGCALNGNIKGVNLCLEKMWSQGVKPDQMIYTSIISACSHSGVLHETCSSINAMDITLSTEHPNGMIDFLGRIGCLKEAEDMLRTMAPSPGAMGLTSLVSSCRTYCYMDLGSNCRSSLDVSG